MAQYVLGDGIVSIDRRRVREVDDHGVLGWSLHRVAAKEGRTHVDSSVDECLLVLGNRGELLM